jgi:ABC-type polysaccharide/polyol phosphate transport system ATPase subunit
MQYNQSNISTNIDIAIEVNNIRKRYRLFKSRNDRVKEAIRLGIKKYHQEFWALDGISFSIIKGETIGILGRNGSGKSTLLQILASVMTETTGDVVVNGRVSALLELGAGFKPEFTGRENVILNGVIQGVSEKQMIEKIDEIREFADVGDYFDQPVGSYSSGMFLRLAFACAMNVDPDILIIDEALAVGDIKFQQRCISKIEEFSEQGKTVILVSHDMQLLNYLCQRCILLDKGQLIEQGTTEKVTEEYIRSVRAESQVRAINNKKSFTKNGKAYGISLTDLMSVEISGRDGIATTFEYAEKCTIKVTYRVNVKILHPRLMISIRDYRGYTIYGKWQYMDDFKVTSDGIDNYIECELSIDLILATGTYAINLSLQDYKSDNLYSLIDRHVAVENIYVKDGSYKFNGIINIESGK